MRLKSIFTNGTGILSSRILGFIRDMLMASILGVNIFSDIFAIAFKIPNLFRRIFGEGAFVQSFMPSFVASKHKGVFATTILLRFLLFIILASVLVNLFAPYLTKSIAIGFDEDTIALASPLVAINFWYLDLIFLVTFLATLLQYKEHFATTAFSTALLNISMIIALILYAKESPQMIVYALSISVVVGGVLQLIAHLITIRRFKLDKLLVGGFKYRDKRDISDDTKRFNSQFFPAIIGSSTAQISAFLDTMMASFLITGSISYLYYANRVFQLPLALFAIATATALFPTISKAIKNGDEAKAYQNLSKAFWILSFTLGFSLIGGVVFSEHIIWLLFERGEFTNTNTIESAKVLMAYMVGLLPFGLAKLFSLILMQYYGAMGLALASSIGGWVLFILTIKEVGFDRFIDIIYSKYSLYFIVSLSIFIVISIWINEIIKGFM